MKKKNNKNVEILFTDSGISMKERDVFGILVSVFSFIISFWLIFFGALAIMS